MDKKFNSLKRLHDSTNLRVVALEKENKRLNAAIQLLLAEKAQWIQSKELQQQIIHQQITTSNEENHRLKEEIQRLRNGKQCH